MLLNGILIPVITKVGNNIWKPSIPDAQNALVVHVNVCIIVLYK